MPRPPNPRSTPSQALTKMLYATLDEGLYTIDMNDLTVPLPFAWVSQAQDVYGECAFSADYTVLYGTNSNTNGEFQIIDQQTGAITSLGFNANPKVFDLGGSSFFGTNGPSLILMEVRPEEESATFERRHTRDEFRQLREQETETLAPFFSWFVDTLGIHKLIHRSSPSP